MHPQINLSDWYAVVGIWQRCYQEWTLIEVVRLKQAISICRQQSNDEPFMVFPSQIDPRGCYQHIYPVGSDNSPSRHQTRKRQKPLRNH